jgi:endonuclease-8
VGGRIVTAARPASLARLTGRRLLGVQTAGKHLYMRFGDGIALHTHMRMTGAWHVYSRDQRWRRARHLATSVLDFDGVVAVLFAAPVCELIAERRIGEGLGPDILGSPFDAAGVLARVRASSDRTIAEVLLDQSVCAGIGNIYRCDAPVRCARARSRPIRSGSRRAFCTCARAASPAGAHAVGSTQWVMTIHCSTAAAMTRVWKISWKPKVRGQGLGRCRA